MSSGTLSAFDWRGKSSMFAPKTADEVIAAGKKRRASRAGQHAKARASKAGAAELKRQQAAAAAPAPVDLGKPPRTYNIKGLAALPISSEFRLPGSRRDRAA